MKTIVILITVAFAMAYAGRNASPPKGSNQPDHAAPAHLCQLDAADQFFSVSGEVKEPGRFLWTEGITLTNAIAMAGGFTHSAERERVEVMRPSKGSKERYDYGRIMSGLLRDLLLEPTDVVFVPKLMTAPR